MRRRRPSLWPRLAWIGVPALAMVVLAVVLIGRSPAVSGRSRLAASVSREELVQEAVKDYEQYVRGIDSAVVECAAAMDENPGNVRVRESYRGASADRSAALDQLVSGGD
jgi:hypothetical protein